MPMDGLGGQKPKVYANMVSCFDNKPGEHRNSGTVQEIQFSHVDYDRFGGACQGALDQIQNGRIILRARQTQRALENHRGIVLIEVNLERLPIHRLHAETPERFLRGSTALVVTVMISAYVG